MKNILHRYNLFIFCFIGMMVFAYLPVMGVSPNVTYSVTNVTCNAGNNGTITTTVSGGTSPYTYLWSNNETTDQIINLSATTYTVTVTDNSSQTATVSIMITQPLPLTASITGTLTICAFDSTILSTQLYAGYLWSTGETGQSILVKPSTDTSYEVTVTDVNGCTTSASATVT